MSGKEWLKESWQRFLEALKSNDRQKLLDLLCKEYVEEAQDLSLIHI